MTRSILVAVGMLLMGSASQAADKSIPATLTINGVSHPVTISPRSEVVPASHAMASATTKSVKSQPNISLKVTGPAKNESKEPTDLKQAAAPGGHKKLVNQFFVGGGFRGGYYGGFGWGFRRPWYGGGGYYGGGFVRPAYVPFSAPAYYDDDDYYDVGYSGYYNPGYAVGVTYGASPCGCGGW